MEISLLKMHLSLLLLLEYNVISMGPTQPASTERLLHDLPSPVPQAGCVLAVLLPAVFFPQLFGDRLNLLL